MKDIYDILAERGFIEQCTHEQDLRKSLADEKMTFYIGFDPTADSLHVGHFLTVMAMSHMQKAGHRPIALCGGGTGMIGDPSGKADMRKMMTIETIRHNVNCFKKQLSKFINFENGNAIMADNSDWLLKLNYVDFLREIGTHFSVNRMITSEAFKARMEREAGLSFLEFNYMIMQAYDFLELYKRYGCKMQMGGNDQWSNIIAGVDLIRRTEATQAFGLTLKLLTNSQGVKMGKTVSGAVWLDPEKTSPYDFYQYWRNIDDADVEKCLGLLTFLPMDEVKRLGALKDAEINIAKETLAFELTKNVHSESAAKEAQQAAKALFEGGIMAGSVPTTTIEGNKLENGIPLLDLLSMCNLIASKSEGRRLVSQGGIKINNEKIDAFDYIVSTKDIKDDAVMIQKGKKIYHQVKI